MLDNSLNKGEAFSAQVLERKQEQLCPQEPCLTLYQLLLLCCRLVDHVEYNHTFVLDFSL